MNFFFTVIDNFFESYTPFLNSLCEEISSDFTKNKDDYYVYDNVFEKKKAMKIIPPKSKEILDFFNSATFIEKMCNLSGIDNLEADPFLHGAGLHLYEKNSFLEKHLDYSINPKSGKQRRINLIIFLTDWDPSFGGALQFYDTNTKKIIQKIYPQKNRAVIFETNDYSLHGVEKVTENVERKILTVFYVSEPEKNIECRYKAHFDTDDKNLMDLAKIRSVSLL
jgi:Rps23 Pro-64 3,4-dihydroxylase Tpa1-like proline 4-hydroxylase